MGHFYYDFIAAAVAILATKHLSHKPVLLILLYEKAYTSLYMYKSKGKFIHTIINILE